MAICPYCGHGRTVNAAVPCPSCGKPCAAPDAQWFSALESYSYPVDLRGYPSAITFPGFFRAHMSGNRKSTMRFERHVAGYMLVAPRAVATEIVFWKNYSRNLRTATLRADAIAGHLAHPAAQGQFRREVLRFVAQPTHHTLLGLATSMGYGAHAHPNRVPVATASSVAALFFPSDFPVVDIHIARWVNANSHAHSMMVSGAPRAIRLVPFAGFGSGGAGLVRSGHFPAYSAWILWSREQASLLNASGHVIQWRSRDVEMAVFQAQRSRRVLPPL